MSEFKKNVFEIINFIEHFYILQEKGSLRT